MLFGNRTCPTLFRSVILFLFFSETSHDQFPSYLACNFSFLEMRTCSLSITVTSEMQIQFKFTSSGSRSRPISTQSCNFPFAGSRTCPDSIKPDSTCNFTNISDPTFPISITFTSDMQFHFFWKQITSNFNKTRHVISLFWYQSKC